MYTSLFTGSDASGDEEKNTLPETAATAQPFTEKQISE